MRSEDAEGISKYPIDVYASDYIKFGNVEDAKVAVLYLNYFLEKPPLLSQ